MPSRNTIPIPQPNMGHTDRVKVPILVTVFVHSFSEIPQYPEKQIENNIAYKMFFERCSFMGELPKLRIFALRNLLILHVVCLKVVVDYILGSIHTKTDKCTDINECFRWRNDRFFSQTIIRITISEHLVIA